MLDDFMLDGAFLDGEVTTLATIISQVDVVEMYPETYRIFMYEVGG